MFELSLALSITGVAITFLTIIWNACTLYVGDIDYKNFLQNVERWTALGWLLSVLGLILNDNKATLAIWGLLAVTVFVLASLEVINGFRKPKMPPSEVIKSAAELQA